MLTSAKKKLRHMKRKSQMYAGVAAMSLEEVAKTERLLRNSNFRLIHVPEKGEGGWQPPLRIVIPAVDRATRKEVREKRYFTVSHLWGPKEEWEPWTSHGIIGIDGKIVEVKIRPEKRNTLFHLLRSRPGYWWIDIFCAQSDTPLSIMGDVYRFCHRCYALVDYPSTGFHPMEAVGTFVESLEWVDALVRIYTERIKGKMGSKDVTWLESLEDLLAGWYYPDSVYVKALADFFSCQWFKRVWTLQEYILPSALTFISEDGPVHAQFDRTILTPIIETLCKIAFRPLQLNFAPATDADYQTFYLCMSNDQYNHVISSPGLSRCYFDLTRFDAFSLYNWYGISDDQQAFNSLPLRYVSSNLDCMIIVLTMIARLPRECMYERDYIYGVSGLLDMKIPAGRNDQEVWHSFRKNVQKRAPYVKFPETNPLSGARNMQDVYKMFIGLDLRAYIKEYHEYCNSVGG